MEETEETQNEEEDRRHHEPYNSEEKGIKIEFFGEIFDVFFAAGDIEHEP